MCDKLKLSGRNEESRIANPRYRECEFIFFKYRNEKAMMVCHYSLYCEKHGLQIRAIGTSAPIYNTKKLPESSFFYYA